MSENTEQVKSAEQQKKQADFNRTLKKMRNLQILDLIFIVGGAALGIVSLLWAGGLTWKTLIPVVIGFLFLVFGGWQYSSILTKLRTDVVLEMIKMVLDENFDHVVYEPDGHFPQELIEKTDMGFPFTFSSIHSCDRIQGRCDGTKFDLCNVVLKENVTRGSGDNAVAEMAAVFRGQWLLLDTGRPLIYGDVRISRRIRDKNAKKVTGNVKSTDHTFNQKYWIEAENPHDALYVLTPEMMSAIDSLNDRAAAGIHMRFLQDGRLIVALNTTQSMFEVSASKVTAEKMHAQFTKEAREIAQIMRLLTSGLNSEE